MAVTEGRNNLSYETGCMSEEDQHYIARAALVGVRFWKSRVEQVDRTYWHNDRFDGGMATLGRSAAQALGTLGHIDAFELRAYLARTEHLS